LSKSANSYRHGRPLQARVARLTKYGPNAIPGEHEHYAKNKSGTL
jgi:hypothetical protein